METDYISREAAIENFMQYTWYDEDGSPIDDCDKKRDNLEDMFSSIPAADVRPVKEGVWMPIIEGNEYGEAIQIGCYCSQCGEQLQSEPYYCPNCGAKMGDQP